MQKNRFSNLNSKLWLFLILGDTCKYVKVCPQFLISITWQPILANNIKWLILTFVQVPSCWSGPSILKKYYINGHNVIGPTCTNLSSAHAKRHLIFVYSQMLRCHVLVVIMLLAYLILWLVTNTSIYVPRVTSSYIAIRVGKVGRYDPTRKTRRALAYQEKWAEV